MIKMKNIRLSPMGRMTCIKSPDGINWHDPNGNKVEEKDIIEDSSSADLIGAILFVVIVCIVNYLVYLIPV